MVHRWNHADEDTWKEALEPETSSLPLSLSHARTCARALTHTQLGTRTLMQKSFSRYTSKIIKVQLCLVRTETRRNKGKHGRVHSFSFYQYLEWTVHFKTITSSASGDILVASSAVGKGFQHWLMRWWLFVFYREETIWQILVELFERDIINHMNVIQYLALRSGCSSFTVSLGTWVLWKSYINQQLLI